MRRVLLIVVSGLIATAAVAASERKAICVTECFIPDSAYPRAAKSTGIEGIVQFTFLIGIDGRVSSCEIVASSNPALADDSICNVVKARWRYKPALAGGVPIEESRTQKAGFFR